MLLTRLALESPLLQSEKSRLGALLPQPPIARPCLLPTGDVLLPVYLPPPRPSGSRDDLPARWLARICSDASGSAEVA